MNEHNFSDYLHEYAGLCPERRERLLEHSRIIELSKGDIILRPGEVCRHRFFVERGAVREYSIDPSGKEHNLLFALEGWFIINVESVFFARPSSYFVEAIESTRLRLIEESEVKALMQEDEGFEKFDRDLLYEHIRALQHRITSLQSTSAMDRYLHFIKAYPEMVLRLPQGLIASYLGITPESLSRIRRAIADR